MPLHALTKDELVWEDHRGRRYALRDMETSHMVNICRRIVNRACKEAGIEPIPIRAPLAEMNFDALSNRTWVQLCQMFYNEIKRRTDTGEELTASYAHVLRMIELRIDALTGRSAPQQAFLAYARAKRLGSGTPEEGSEYD